MVQIEINLTTLHKAESSGRPGLVKRKVKVHRGGKVFEQYRWVKSGEDKPSEKKGAVEDIASGLKPGMTINFKGEDKKIQFYNTAVKTVTFVDDINNYSFDDINKYGKISSAPKKPPAIMGLNKPEEYDEPQAIESESKVIGSAKDGSLSSKDRKQATANMETFISELEAEEEGKDLTGDESVRKAGNYYTKGNAIDFNTYLIADKKQIMDVETRGLKDISSEDKEYVEQRMEVLDEFLDRAPKVKGTSYRAMWWDPNDSVQKKRFDDFMSNLESGNIVKSKPYSSTTTSKSMMKDFTKMAKGGDITAHVEYESNGVYLDGESKSPEQQEVLIGHGVEFEVASVKFNEKANHVDIKFREVGLNE